MCGIEYSFDGLLVYHGPWFLRSAKIVKEFVPRKITNTFHQTIHNKHPIRFVPEKTPTITVGFYSEKRI
jgi:hypothetical protein